ncbi:hypothetical protein EBT23_07505, partial [bacterium]|nr:hypothetical protein [bacterium]
MLLWSQSWIRMATLLLLALSSCSSQPPPPVPAEATKAEPTQKKEPTPVATESASLPGKMWEGKTLLMHYMPWYETPQGRGKWGSHWTGH